MDTTNQTETVEGFSKEQILSLKAAIKYKVAEQKLLKPQRKTVHFKGERTVTPGQAVWTHYLNRYELRHMYIAYGIMRGKTIEQIEGKSHTAPDMQKVEQILKQYGKVVCNNS